MVRNVCENSRGNNTAAYRSADPCGGGGGITRRLCEKAGTDGTMRAAFASIVFVRN